MSTTNTSAEIVYRGMNRAALDAAYNNGAAVADSARWMDQWRARSQPARSGRGVRLDLPYAPQERTKIDLFSAQASNAPLFVFLHGGYWVRNSRDMFSFLAEGPNAHGINVAVAGYTLAPAVHLSDIVDEIDQCLTFLGDQAGELGFDRHKIFVGGWSAGGHLAAMACRHPNVRGTLPISGIFDLEPIALSYLNDPLQLTSNDIATLSPLHLLHAGGVPQRLVVGSHELAELKRQSRDYADAARAADLDARVSILPEHHHYSILDELAKPDGLITRELRDMIANVT